jgi:hypothetical protein
MIAVSLDSQCLLPDDPTQEHVHEDLKRELRSHLPEKEISNMVKKMNTGQLCLASCLIFLGFIWLLHLSLK